MSTRKIVLGFLVASLVLLIVGFYLTNSYKFGLCFSDLTTNTFDVSCHSRYENVGTPLFYGMPALAFVFLILMFVPRAFPAWKKFAKWFIPLATLLFILYPEPGSGDYFSPYPEQVFRWVSFLYVILSVVVIFRAFRQERKNRILPS